MANVTLMEAAHSIEDPRVQSIAQTYALESHVWLKMPINQIVGSSYKWEIFDDLPYSTSAAAYRAYGSDFTSSKSRSQIRTQDVKVAGGKVQIDRAINKIAPAEIAKQRRMQIAANSYVTTKDVFEGAGGNGIFGINSWITYDPLFSSQSVDMGTASTGAVVTLDGLDELMSKVNIQPGRTYLYMNDAVARRVKKLSRGVGTDSSTAQNINYSPFELGMWNETYQGVPIVITKDGAGTDYLSNAEGDGSSTTIYCVTYGDQALEGFQNGNMDMFTLGDMTSDLGFDYEMLINIAPQSKRCIARMRYVVNSIS